MSHKRKTPAKVAPENVASNKSVKKPDTSTHVHQRDKIDWELRIRGRDDFTDKQKKLIELILSKESKIVYVSGPAGVSKTFLAVYCGLILLNQKRLSDIIYVRTIIESASKSLGSLPGDQNLKMGPFLMPMEDKLEEMLSSSDIKRLMTEERVKGLPVNYLRGASLNSQYIILDENQNYSFFESKTAITRLGAHSKMIILGDPRQSDLVGKSGFKTYFDLFNDQESQDKGIFCFEFTKDDIVRNGILKYVIEKIEGYEDSRPDKAK